MLVLFIQYCIYISTYIEELEIYLGSFQFFNERVYMGESIEYVVVFCVLIVIQFLWVWDS